MSRRGIVVFWCALSCVSAIFATESSTALGYSHTVKVGETLSQIAARVYGDAGKETVLAGANALDVQGGSGIVPGMRLEVPAPSHHTVVSGDTWRGLALAWLGDAGRADVLARLNHAVSWIDPPEGLAVVIPAVIAHISADGDSTSSLARRYWGDANRGWEINAFNGRKEEPLRRGEVMLIWLPDLELTDAGREEALASASRANTQADTARLDVQRRADAEIPLLKEDVRSGRYVESVARGNRIIGSGPLTKPELALVYRALLEAYVALENAPLAAAACSSWRANDPLARLDATQSSPKVRAACPR